MKLKLIFWVPKFKKVNVLLIKKGLRVFKSFTINHSSQMTMLCPLTPTTLELDQHCPKFTN